MRRILLFLILGGVIIGALILLAHLLAAPYYELPLGKPVSEVRGFTWPRFHAKDLLTTRTALPDVAAKKHSAPVLAALEGTYLPTYSLEDPPSRTTLRFPSGHAWTTLGRVGVISQKKDKLVSIYLAPHIYKVRFTEALQLAERAARQLALNDGERVLTDIRKWKALSPQELRTHQRLEEGVSIAVEIKDSGDDQWIVWFYFTDEKLLFSWN